MMVDDGDCMFLRNFCNTVHSHKVPAPKTESAYHSLIKLVLLRIYQIGIQANSKKCIIKISYTVSLKMFHDTGREF
jgi:hypothetical protein